MNRRLAFGAVLLATALIVFLAQSIQYRGPSYMTLAGTMSLALASGCVAFWILAARAFGQMGARDVLLAIIGAAVLPIAVDWLLELNGTPVNVHGLILWYGFYFLGSELCALALLVAFIVRFVIRQKRRTT